MVHRDVHFFDKDAVGWHAVALVDVDDVAYNEVANRDALDRAKGTTVNGDVLIVDLVLEF